MKLMSDVGFSTEWLDLREPADHAARDAALLAHATQLFEAEGTILDLGAGTGSTARAFNGATDGKNWRFLDGNSNLLSFAAERHPGSAQICADLSDIETIDLTGVSLVTASALLDLMPMTWIEKLARRLQSEGISLYAALNYNGEMTWTPKLADDVSITATFNAHQLTDKGLGPAVGPDAATITKQIFEKHGFEISLANSPWMLGTEHIALHDELIKGIAKAALEAGHAGADDWLVQRKAKLNTSTVRIGHTDVLAMANKE